MNSKKKYIEENMDIINEMIEKKRPKFEIARVLNIKYVTLNKHFKALGIDYEGNPNRKGLQHLEARKSVYSYLGTERNISASALRIKLINSGLKEEKCECCGLSEWMGKKIPLELHHMNNSHYDNRLENLQILCSNCHSIAHKYSNTKEEMKPNLEMFNKIISNTKEDVTETKKINKKRKKREKQIDKQYCINCGKELTSKQKKYCSQECYHEYISKRPSAIELLAKYKELNGNKTKLGQCYGVSDNAVKKWLKSYNII